MVGPRSPANRKPLVNLRRRLPHRLHFDGRVVPPGWHGDRCHAGAFRVVLGALNCAWRPDSRSDACKVHLLVAAGSILCAGGATQRDYRTDYRPRHVQPCAAAGGAADCGGGSGTAGGGAWRRVLCRRRVLCEVLRTELPRLHHWRDESMLASGHSNRPDPTGTRARLHWDVRAGSRRGCGPLHARVRRSLCICETTFACRASHVAVLPCRVRPAACDRVERIGATQRPGPRRRRGGGRRRERTRGARLAACVRSDRRQEDR